MADPSELIRYEAIRHRCPHCRKSWADKSRARRHIKVCQKRAANRACGTCQHFCAGSPSDLAHHDPGEPPGCAEGIAWPDSRPITNCARWEIRR